MCVQEIPIKLTISMLCSLIPGLNCFLLASQVVLVVKNLPANAAAAANSLQSCPLCATPETAAHQALPFMGFSRQEYWSGVPLPSPTANAGDVKDVGSISGLGGSPRGGNGNPLQYS